MTNGDDWRRLNPLSPLVGLGRGAVGIAVIALPALLFERGGSWGTFVYVPILVLTALGGFVSWLVTRWRVRGTVLEKEEGLLKRRSLRFPLSQVQAIDVIRPGIARALGLAELRLRMGGSTRTAGRLAYLRVHEAFELRTQLLELGHASPSATVPTLAPVESQEVIVTTPTPRLLASLAISNANVVLLTVLVVSVALLGGRGSGAYVLGAALTLWRRFDGEYRLNVAQTHDGLVLRGGLVTTVAETIPRGRVQAVKLIEPFLWRRLGWCRLQVDLAGAQHRSGESTAEGRRARTVLPVGRRRQVDDLLAILLPTIPTERSRPPVRAMWKTPLRYHHLSWGRTDDCVVTTSGRMTRVTTWVPLEKVQSFRLVCGPAQKRLRLATVHLDAAGRGVHAALRDRDREEGERALAELVSLARVTRREKSIAATS